MKKIAVILIALTVIVTGCTNKGGEQGVNTKKESSALQEDPGESERSSDEESKDAGNMKKDPQNAFYFTCSTEGENEKIGVAFEAHDRDGNVIWNRTWNRIGEFEEDFVSDVVARNKMVYVWVHGTLYALDVDTGYEVWTSENVGDVYKLYINENRLYLLGGYGSLLRCVDIESGEQIWNKDYDDIYWGSKIGMMDGNIAVECSVDRNDEIMEQVVLFDKEGNIASRYEGELPEKKVIWNDASASSTLESNMEKYGPKNVTDGDYDTAWVEGASGYGIGEYIALKNSTYEKIGNINVVNGYWKTHETYENNGAAEQFRIDFSDGKYLVYEERGRGKDSYYFEETEIFLAEPVRTNSLKLTILDAIEGKKYEDTCITEIKAY